MNNKVQTQLDKIKISEIQALKQQKISIQIKILHKLINLKNKLIKRMNKIKLFKMF